MPPCRCCTHRLRRGRVAVPARRDGQRLTPARRAGTAALARSQAGVSPYIRFYLGGVRARCAPRPPALQTGRGLPAEGSTGRGWNARTKPRQCVGRPALCPAVPPEGFAKCKFSAPVRGYKIGLVKPNFAKPAHLAKPGGGAGWALAGVAGARRGGRGALGGCVRYYNRKMNSPRLYRWGLFVNFGVAARSKVSGWKVYRG